MRPRFKYGIILLIFSILACNTPANLTPTQTLAPPGTPLMAGDLGFGDIHGQVTDGRSGKPIAGAQVICNHYSYVTQEGDRCNRNTITEEDGRFIFEDIYFHDTDQILLTVEAAGYDPTTVRQGFFTRNSYEADIQLTPRDTQLPTSTNGPMIENCPMFPADNIWNTPVEDLPVHPSSGAWVDSIGRDEHFHMDFGSGKWDGGPIGIPFNVVPGSKVDQYAFEFDYPDESDPGPYPLPEDPLREWGSDHHILVLDTDTCMLYEVYDASFEEGAWSGGSGAIWDLNSNELRPETWTSADAAGLPILPGLARYDEIEAGEIKHALRFTIEDTAGYIWPARHQTTDPQDGIPPMGARFRLKADYDISDFPPEMQVLLQAFKTYGIMLADNGANWYVGGAPDERWEDDMLHLLDGLQGDDFEAVDTSVMMVDSDSGEARP